MKTTFLVLAALAAAATLRAQTFETQIMDTLRPFAAEDAFAGVGACGVLDIKTLRPFGLEEAAALVKPCLDAVAAKYSTRAAVEAGLLAAPVGKAGLLIKTDLTAGSKGHRDLAATLARRQGFLLGHPAKILTRDEVRPASASSLQRAIDGCMLSTVVRDVRNGEDFVKIFGNCLTRDAELKIKELRAAEGLAVTIKTEAAAQVEGYNGFLTVNAGKGPVQIMVVAYGPLVYLP